MSLSNVSNNIPARNTMEGAAYLARGYAKNGVGFLGTFASHNPDESHSIAGHPFSLMNIFIEDCENNNGDIILFLTKIQMAHQYYSQNPKVNFAVSSNETTETPLHHPRFSIFGDIEVIPRELDSIVRECYMDKFHAAKGWANYHDFDFYRIKVKDVYYVGGFGGANYIGFIDKDTYHAAGLTDSAAAEVQRF